jgi:CRP-like cAMP-binding protein
MMPPSMEEDPGKTPPLGSPTPSPATVRWVRRVPAGQSLFGEGDVDRKIYVLLDGKVEIVKGTARVAEIGVGDTFIGEISALTGKPRWASARTLTASTIIEVEDVAELFRADPAWGLRLAKTLAERLDRTNERLTRVQTLLEETRAREGDGDETFDTLQIVISGGEKTRD